MSDTSNVQKFDFSALDGLDNTSPARYWYILLALLLPCLTLMVFKPLLGLFPAIAVGIWTLFAYKRSQLIAQQNTERLKAFAAANELAYRAEPVTDFSENPGTLFLHGHAKKATQIFEGTLSKFPFRLFRYEYATGSGKSRRDYDAEVMEITLPVVQPHMVIDSLIEDGNGGLSTLPIDFNQSQKIELEGDFNAYFSLYAPDTYGVTALTILAPDVMQALIQHAALCDIEIIDNKLYFYWPKVAADRRDYEHVFQTVQDVLAETGRTLSRIDSTASSTQTRVQTAVTNQGVRLKKGSIKWLTGLMIVTALGAQFADKVDSPLSIPIGIIIMIGFLIFLIAIARRELKREKLLKGLQSRYQNYKN